jgi:hypothetical protein
MFLTYDIIRSIAGFPKVNVRVDPQIVSRSSPFSKPTMKSHLLKHSFLLLAAATAVSSSEMGTYNGTDAPVETALTSGCTQYHQVQNGDNCHSIQDKYMSFTLAQFFSWNP